jgi:hypothetical protein
MGGVTIKDGVDCARTHENIDSLRCSKYDFTLFVYSCIPHSPYMGWAHIFIHNAAFTFLFVLASCKTVNSDMLYD